MKIDLHNHTSYSDGLYTPKELLEIAKREHVDCFALTDHDSVFGCEEIQSYAKECNIHVLSGMELSTEYKGHSVHIVCLFKNNIVPQELIDFSNSKKEERKERAIKMMEKIKEIYQVKIDMRALLEENEVITRANMCYNIAKCNNISEREAEIYVDHKSKAYIPSTKLSVQEGLAMVKKAGCLTILAHPCLLPKAIVEEIISMGFDGIEIRYPKNQEGDEEYFRRLALKYNLLISAGSDFHGDHGTKHAMIGASTLNEEEFRPIQERLEILW
ncbi:MAG: PHP domain-containing protein [Roseburia sp.]|nr:PHP domain-containing protein [Anaeroplasma bactoclasticum]MCM1197154.1 PHP domain-containing protein [Roseburia sp.]MCM1556683.1 PHP domain-containing protein [Anaeroplasma bactoclasticum]